MVQNSKEAIVAAISSLASSLGDKRLAAPEASLSSSSMYLFVAPSITDAIQCRSFLSRFAVVRLSFFVVVPISVSSRWRPPRFTYRTRPSKMPHGYVESLRVVIKGDTVVVTSSLPSPLAVTYRARGNYGVRAAMMRVQLKH